jgi:hypothetical protein
MRKVCIRARHLGTTWARFYPAVSAEWACLIWEVVDLMRTILGSSLLSGAIAALLWIIISFATGAPALFSLGGGIACGVVVFIIGSGIRRLVLDRHKAAAAGPRLSAAFAGRCRNPVRCGAAASPRRSAR